MNIKRTVFFALALLTIGAPAWLEAKVKPKQAKPARGTASSKEATKSTKTAPPAKPAAETKTASPPAPRPKVEMPVEVVNPDEVRFYRYKLNMEIGTFIVSGTGAALTMGGQFGYAPSPGSPLYFGPEFNFSLFSPGTTMLVLANGWYEFRVVGAPRLSIALGASLGPAFVSDVSNLSTITFASFAEVVLNQDINELASVRMQLRPGFIGSYFAFMLNFNVGFRFM